MESSYQPEDQLISNYSKHLINAETVNLSFPHDKSVMGYHDDPTIEFYPPGTYDPEKIEKVYIFGSVGLDPTITVNNNGQATAGANTFLYYEADDLSSTHNVNFNVPGFWHLKAVVLYDGLTFYSDVLEIEIWFPSTYDMEQDTYLASEMESLWQETLDAASSTSRREMGFWIYAYVDNNGLEFEIGDEEEGPQITGCVGTNGSIAPGSPDVELPSAPDDTEVKFYVGYFHTHTTLHYCSSGSRDTGLSDGDEDYASNNTIPILLYDYSASIIYAGHDLDDPYELYYTDQVEKRETPTFWIGN